MKPRCVSRWTVHIYCKNDTRTFQCQVRNTSYVINISYCSLARLQNYEKRPLTSSCLSDCLSVRPSEWHNSGPTGQIFMKFDTWGFFKNLTTKLKYDKNRVLYMKVNKHFMITPHSIFLRMRNVSDKSCSENQTTHCMLNNFFFPKIVPFMRQCGKKMVRPDGP